VGVNTSPDYVNPSGKLTVVSMESKSIVHEIVLPGQPDAVSVSSADSDYPKYIAVAIENERDEDLGDGEPPQMPAGSLAIITIADEAALTEPSTWTLKEVVLANDSLLAEACRFPEDPEPEYVDIHPDNTQVLISLQENNCNVLVNLESGTVTAAFDAGSVSLDQIDQTEDGLILQTESTDATGLLREPDGISWIGSTQYFATANEGDLDGGSRGWSIVDSTDGTVVYDSGVSMEWLTASIGHYPDERSGNKGNEPENVLYSAFGDREYVFVLSERSSVVFVYLLSSPTEPVLQQILPVGTAPEGITTIPSLNLVVIASEEDARDDKIRSSIAIFKLFEESSKPFYPTLTSQSRDDGSPIPFAALSGLAAGVHPHLLYTIEDSFYNKNRILTIDTKVAPAEIVKEQRIMDTGSVLAECLTATLGDGVELSDIINDDKTVNIDPEGISVSASGGFVIASEGSGTVGDEDKPYKFPNFLIKTDDDAVITSCILLPESFPDQVRFGFEGVAEDGDKLVVTIQRAWGGEANPRVAVYDTVTGEWKYAFYPLDTPLSQNGGWVGLSDISSIGNGKFMVIERDNQGGPDAAIKSLCEIDLGDYSFEDGITLEKTFVLDLIPSLTESNGPVLEKVEGLAVTMNGFVWVNTDNDGVDDSSGESALLQVTKIVEDVCTTKGSFVKSKNQVFTCKDLAGFGKRRQRNYCKKSKVSLSCPGVCNPLCTCTDKKKFKFKLNKPNKFKGKSFRCNKLGKNDKQPTCDTEVAPSILASGLCPKKCGICIE